MKKTVIIFSLFILMTTNSHPTVATFDHSSSISILPETEEEVELKKGRDQIEIMSISQPITVWHGDDYIRICIQNPSLLNLNAELFDEAGSLVLSNHLNTPGQSNYHIDISDLEYGEYTIVLSTPTGGRWEGFFLH